VDLQTLANADAALDLEDAAAQYVMQKLLIQRERNFASTYMTTSVWDTDVTGVDSSPTSVQTIRWDADNASGDPIVDVQTGNAMLCYSAPQPGLMTPTAGYTFSWRGYLNQANDFGIAMKRIPMPHLESNRIEGGMAYDQKVVTTAMGYFWSSIVS